MNPSFFDFSKKNKVKKTPNSLIFWPQPRFPRAFRCIKNSGTPKNSFQVPGRHALTKKIVFTFHFRSQPQFSILACFLLHFHQNRTRERATFRISANFFSGILESLGASEKNSVDFRKNIFHAYFSCKSPIARDRDFEVKTSFQRDLRANYGNGSA